MKIIALAVLLAAGAAAPLYAAELSEGWLFMGRRSGEGWRPASASIAQPRYPVKAGDKVVVRADALVYGSVDCNVTALADFGVEKEKGTVRLVKADRAPLEVLAAPLECPSAGRARTVWVNVRISADRLVRVEK